MKTEKISFKNIKDVLSRDEMKGIMAGSGSTCGSCQDKWGTWSCSGPLGCTSCPSAEIAGNKCS